MERIKVQVLRDGVGVPQQAKEGDAGYDLQAAILVAEDLPPHVGAKLVDSGRLQSAMLVTQIADVEVSYGKVTRIPTGVAFEIPPGWMGLILPRSGRSADGLHVFPGVIDRTYRGEVSVQVLNLGPEELTIWPFERIAQIVFLPCYDAPLERVDALGETGRGDGGFGSTGR